MSKSQQRKAFVKALGVAESLNEGVGQVVSVLVYGIVAVVSYEVVVRSIFHSATIWGFETSRFLFSFMCLVGGGYVLLYGGHVNVDILQRRLTPRGRAIMDLFTSAFFFLFAGMLLWQGISLFLNSVSYWEHSTTAWAPPLYPIKLAIPVGAALILLQGLVKFIKDIVLATRGWI